MLKKIVVMISFIRRDSAPLEDGIRKVAEHGVTPDHFACELVDRGCVAAEWHL
jgi:hypothetical protein